MKEIALLPDNLLRTPSVGLVSTWYAKSFEEVIDFEKSEPTPENLARFVSILNHIRDRHADVVQTMAHGILELKETQNNQVEPGMETSIQYFLDRFYMSRISIRMLINQHSKLLSDVAHWSLLERSVLENFAAILFGQIPQTSEHIGCIEVDCYPRSVVNDAYENARWLCDQYYLGAPEMEIIEHNGEFRFI